MECRAGRGLIDDRFFDYKPDYKGQITFFNWSVYERVRDEIVKDDLHPSAFRRNVIIRGIDLNDLIGKRFNICGVSFSGSGECSPCYWMDEACGPGTHVFLKRQGGLRARILTDGKLYLGDHTLETFESTND